MKKKEWDSLTHTLPASQEERIDSMNDVIFKEIMAEIFPNLMRDTNIQMQETKLIPPRFFIVKPENTKLILKFIWTAKGL